MIICPGLLEIIKTQIQWVFFKMYLFMAHVAINNLIRDFIPTHHTSGTLGGDSSVQGVLQCLWFFDHQCD